MWVKTNCKILKQMGTPDHLTCLLRNLYADQEAMVRTGHGTTNWFKFGKGVWEGCILSSCLFNLYVELLLLSISHCHVWLFVTSWTAAHQASLSHTISQSLSKCSCSLHQSLHSAITSSDTFCSFCPWSVPASGTFPVSCLFASDDLNTGASALASVLPVNIQGWSHLSSAALIS